MNKDRKQGNFYILQFFIFSLLFIAMIAALCILRGYIVSKQASRNASLSSCKKYTVVIDAGHGGRDGGATALSAMPEKDLNLDIALAVRDILSLSGIDVIMTRTEDIMLTDGGGGTNKSQDLRARKKIAENAENAIFVSIHMNSFPIEKYYGLQVYHSDNEGKSRELAESIQNLANETISKGSNRKIKNAGDSIYLLDELTCPAILIECGFLSNEAEARKLNDPEYRHAVALLIATSIIEQLKDQSNSTVTAANPNGLT